MEKSNSKVLYGALALLCVAIWGLTFVSMKVAGASFTPAQVMFIRCIIAYVGLLIIHPKFYKVESWQQELLYFTAAICGTTMYVITINSAYDYTQVANVSVLASTSPIFIALLTPLFFKGTKVGARVFVGFIIATIGTICIVTNGAFALTVSFQGDALAILAAIFWACYSLILRKNKSEKPQLYVTRRIFLYGIIAVIPILIIQGEPIAFSALKEPSVMLNMLFLGLVPYIVCHVTWAKVIKKMGPVWTSKFSYLEPTIAMLFSALVLSERITIYMIIGTVIILLGVMISDGMFFKKKDDSEGEKEVVTE